jgi:hypothetical protein
VWGDEGSLGSGVVATGGFGVDLGGHFDVGLAVTRARHEREGVFSWRGDATVVSARLRYRFGAPATSARFFLGGGLGLMRSQGVLTEQVLPSLSAPGLVLRTEHPWSRRGRAWEAGLGVDLALSERVFLRPEAWLSVGRPADPRPPFTPGCLPRCSSPPSFHIF